MSQMVFPCLAIYEDIVKENKDKMTKKRTKYMVHKALKGGGFISEVSGDSGTGEVSSSSS
jgi:hypothetical protein